MQSIWRWVRIVALGGLFTLAGWTTKLPAQPSTVEPKAASPAGTIVVARVDGEPITAAEVVREAERIGGSRASASDDPALLAQLCEHLIDRRLAQQRLASLGLVASEADVDLAIQRLERQLASQNIRPADHYQQIGQTREQVREALRWQLSWQAYLARQLTDENLQKYFAQHARKFDGTRLRIAQILLKPTDESAAARQAAERQASDIRQQITAGKLTFNEAVRRHSTGPASTMGGDLGWIERRQPMPEAIASAAYALAAGEVSPPVWTPLGLHLVQITEIQPGQRTWEDAREDLHTAVTKYLFRWLADGQRPEAKIERNSDWPAQTGGQN